MTEEQQLKLQAFLDDELPESDRREVVAWLAQDADATALLGELKNTRNALKGFEPEIKFPESREFYWSKIKRQIERAETAPAAAPKASLFTWVRRAMKPLGAVAILAVAGFLTFHQLAGRQPTIAVSSMLADAGAFTYRDEAQGMTVVWLSYPAENKFAQKSSSDTLSPK